MSGVPDLKKANYQLIRCGGCDMVVDVPPPAGGEHCECPRCHHRLLSGGGWSLNRCSMIALSILILMPFALTFPLLSINLLGVEINATVWGGIWKMAVGGYPYSAFMVFICAVIMPVSFAVLVLMLRLARWFRLRPRNVLLFLGYIKPWVMFDVYLVALGVAMFKVREYAQLDIDSYLIAFVFTALLTTLLFIKLNIPRLWQQFYPELKPISAADPVDRQRLCLCRACQHNFLPEQGKQDECGHSVCPRCASRLDSTDSLILQGTWATLIAGVIMLLPANLLPISGVAVTGALSEDTLMSGVITFLGMGSYFVGVVVFFASIFVPLSKVAIMLYLLACVHFNWRHSIQRQMKLLHIVHFIGRWSMLDLFVLALMMSLVSRGQIINFTVGPAAFYFGAAVFLSMISASLFDSRLLWKIYDKSKP